MSSVEELCDDITLINKARVILQGNVDDIRREWAGKEYEIMFKGDSVLQENDHYKILSKKKDNGKTVIRIETVSSIGSNDLLQIMVKAGEIISFNPALPSMNDIFIKVVQSRN
jgi:ABC-2 type transport system ATP-binding protein